MEFDGALSVLQGTICSLGSQGLLNTEGSLQDAVEAFRNVTGNLPDDVKSKITFFMVLNTHLSVSEKLKDDEFVGLFTNITPLIDKEYLITYVYHLNLQSQLFKVLENCPGTLGCELADAIIKKLQEPSFHRDEFGLEHFYQLWESVFVKVCKISTGLHRNDHPQKFVDYFSHIYGLIQKILVTSMLMKGVESIVGAHLYHFFKSFLFCIKLSKNPNLSDDPLYNLSIELEGEESDIVGSPATACIDLIFEGVVKILENLTLDLWMTFSECHLDFDSENSAQLLIGTVIYDILEEIKSCDVPLDILNCLSSLSINKLLTAGLDEIISNVRNGKKEWLETLIRHPDVTKEKSVRCLIDGINLASSDDLNMILTMSYEYICNKEQDETLDLMKDLFLAAVKKTPDYSQWLEKVFDNYRPNLLTTSHTQDDLTETFNKISKGKNIPEDELVSLCMQSPLETIKNICDLAVHGSLQTEDVIQILKLLQHPCSVLQCDGSACLDHVLLKSILLEALTDREKQSLINLIVHLGKNNLLGPHFGKNLVKALKTHVENVELGTAVLCLEIVKTTLNSKLFVVDERVLLVFLSQILGHLNWDLESFSTVKADGRDLVIGIVAAIINGLKEGENELEYFRHIKFIKKFNFGMGIPTLEEKKFLDVISAAVFEPREKVILQLRDYFLGSRYQWARTEITKAHEINRVCFCDLWFRFGSCWPNSGKLHSCILALAHSRHKAEDLRQFLVQVEQDLEEKRCSIVLSLAMLLPVLTPREWNSIFDGLINVWESVNSGKDDVDVHHDVLDTFGSCLYLLTLNLKEKATYPCYEYCLRNFGRLVGRTCAKMVAGSLVQTLEKALFVLTAIEDEEEKKSCWMLFSPALMELVDWAKKKNAVHTHKNKIEELLLLLDLKDIAEAVTKRLG